MAAVRMSVAQPLLRVREFGRSLQGAVQSVCAVPNSYVVRLDDGRYFRRTRSAINIDNALSAGFGVPHQPLLPDGGLSPRGS